MRVTRLEIFGFKSFVERFVLNFDENIIGIVGPNGCGKSNIVDALRWVLGETHAKQLRGSQLEDLIFNGSEERRPLGMAEVSLTIRPERDWAKKLKEQDAEELKEFVQTETPEGLESSNGNSPEGAAHQLIPAELTTSRDCLKQQRFSSRVDCIAQVKASISSIVFPAALETWLISIV